MRFFFDSEKYFGFLVFYHSETYQRSDRHPLRNSNFKWFSMFHHHIIRDIHYLNGCIAYRNSGKYVWGIWYPPFFDARLYRKVEFLTEFQMLSKNFFLTLCKQ